MGDITMLVFVTAPLADILGQVSPVLIGRRKVHSES